MHNHINMFEAYKTRKNGKENAKNKNEAPTLSPRVQALLRIEEEILDKETQETVSWGQHEARKLRDVDGQDWTTPEKKEEKRYVKERYDSYADRRKNKYTAELNEQTKSLLDALTPTERAEYQQVSKMNEKHLSESGYDTYEYMEKEKFASEEELPANIRQNLDRFLENHDMDVETIENQQQYPMKLLREAKAYLTDSPENQEGGGIEYAKSTTFAKERIKFAKKRIKGAKKYARESFKASKDNFNPEDYSRYRWTGNLSGDEQRLLESTIEKKLLELEKSEYDTFAALRHGKKVAEQNSTSDSQ